MPETTVDRRPKSAPKQNTPAPLRKLTRRRRTTTQPLPLLREQTLTQIDFVRSSSHHAREPSDDGDDEYEEHITRPPKKKARRKGNDRSASQTTVTQNWRNYVQIYGHGNRGPAEDDDGIEEVTTLLDDETSNVSLEDEQQFEIMESNDVATANIGGHEALPNVSADGAQVSKGGTYDYAEHLLAITSSGRSSKALHSTSSDVESASTRPTSAGSAMAFKTPRKTRRTVVPSSQTPSSLQLSRHKEYSGDFYQQSPLKERSSNITPAVQRNFPFPAKTRRQTQELFETLTQNVDDDSMADAAWSAKLVFTPRKLATPADRHLRRAQTIQDSQGDDLDLFSGQSPGVTKPDEEQQEARFDIERMPSLKRTMTVQDSQAESDAEDLEAECKQHDYDPRFQQTFDPVTAALDRDAARFRRSDTQFISLLEGEEVGANMDMDTIMSTQLDHSPSRGDSVELGCESPSRETTCSVMPAFSRTEVGPARTTRHGKRRSELLSKHHDTDTEEDELPQSATTVAITQERERDDVRLSPYLRALDQDVSAGDEHPHSPISHLHSQLTLESGQFFDQEAPFAQVHQSQISTVMPTQRSRPSSAHGFQLTLQQSASTMAINTLSSSPFPLPPRETSKAGSGIDTQDFSLPPPPQFSSPNRQGSSAPRDEACFTTVEDI